MMNKAPRIQITNVELNLGIEAMQFNFRSRKTKEEKKTALTYLKKAIG